MFGHPREAAVRRGNAASERFRDACGMELDGAGGRDCRVGHAKPALVGAPHGAGRELVDREAGCFGEGGVRGGHHGMNPWRKHLGHHSGMWHDKISSTGALNAGPRGQ